MKAVLLIFIKNYQNLIFPGVWYIFLSMYNITIYLFNKSKSIDNVNLIENNNLIIIENESVSLTYPNTSFIFLIESNYKLNFFL